MERESSSEVATALCRELVAASRPDEVADGAVHVWGAVRAALEPVIGPRGVAALYHRSIHVRSVDFPWLSEVRSLPSSAVDLPALRDALAKRDTADACAGAVALVSTFCDTLATLIGESLVERLLTPLSPPLTDSGESRDSSP